MMTRRHLLTASAAGLACASAARAQVRTYPTRPITMIVPYPAGGPTDVLGRVVAERMSVSLGQPIIIENVSGADGSIGTGRAARAKPDGYTIDLGLQGTHVLNGALYSLPYARARRPRLGCGEWCGVSGRLYAGDRSGTRAEERSVLWSCGKPET
jgi:tripartite-type tricarboxylate transporter receptor subunit TctC